MVGGRDEQAPPPEAHPFDRWSVQPLGEDFAVYDAATSDFHILNAVAHTVWRLARAGEPREGIVRRLAELYPGIDEPRLTKDVDQTLLELRRVSLLPAL